MTSLHVIFFRPYSWLAYHKAEKDSTSESLQKGREQKKKKKKEYSHYIYRKRLYLLFIEVTSLLNSVNIIFYFCMKKKLEIGLSHITNSYKYFVIEVTVLWSSSNFFFFCLSKPWYALVPEAVVTVVAAAYTHLKEEFVTNKTIHTFLIYCEVSPSAVSTVSSYW